MYIHYVRYVGTEVWTGERKGAGLYTVVWFTFKDNVHMYEHVHSCLHVKLLGNSFWYYVYQYLNMDILFTVY